MTIFEQQMDIQPSLFGGGNTPADIDLSYLRPEQAVHKGYFEWDKRYIVAFDDGNMKLIYIYADGRISYYPDARNDFGAVSNFYVKGGRFYESGYTIILPEWLKYRAGRAVKKGVDI